MTALRQRMIREMQLQQFTPRRGGMAFKVGAMLVSIPRGDREVSTPRHKHAAVPGTSRPQAPCWGMMTYAQSCRWCSRCALSIVSTNQRRERSWLSEGSRRKQEKVAAEHGRGCCSS